MDVDSLISYWRDCLADSELRNPDARHGWEVSGAALRSGKLDRTLVTKIFVAAQKRQGRSRQQSHPREDEELSSVALFICPYGLKRRKVHGKARYDDDKLYTPLWIAAKLHRDGSLQGDPNLGAWFVRDHLAPIGGGQPVLGEIEAYDAFLTQNAPPADGEWQAHRKFARQLDDAVVGSGASCLDAMGLSTTRGRVVLGEAKRGAGFRILQLYDAILRDKPASSLLETSVRGSKPLPAPHLISRNEASAGASGTVCPGSFWHSGQMRNDFHLSPSQRQAIHSLEMTPEGGLLAVNGPPGTGKTTMLESVVASLWVNAALAGGKPPVILACASSNQAITNILDRLAGVQEAVKEDSMETRWLPKLKSYGLYLPSKGRFESSTNYAAALPIRGTWEGLPKLIENEEYLRKARAFYLERSRRNLDLDTSRVEDVVKRLEGDMRRAKRQLETLLTMADDLETYRREGGAKDTVQAGIRAKANLAKATAEIDRLNTARREIEAVLDAVPLYEDLLAWWPAVRRRIEARLSRAFVRLEVEAPVRFGRARDASIDRHFDELMSPYQEQYNHAKRWLDLEREFASSVKGLIDDENLRRDVLNSPALIDERLDTTIRYRLFLLACRYWEGQWLLEMDEILSSGAGLYRRKREACEARWRRFAKLTPCLVSTFHTAPGLFDHYDPANSDDGNPNRPLYDFIDLLILEEAGQTSPEIGAAMLALARRALVVGDVHQIEPVWNVQKAVDRANLEIHNLEDAEDLGALRASCGSMMRLGQRATAVSVGAGDPGILLAEHRRCVPEIIGYCNDLVYGGLLRPLRAPMNQRPLPPMGWAQVRSRTERRGSSWFNPGEARAIAGWLSGMREELERHYDEDIAKTVGVITPFAAQKDALKQALAERDLAKVDAGTVHTFQGAERRVIVFSPVYNYGDVKSYFFDHGPNMLNVAVSRAADSFVVIGDMKLFDRESAALPSGLLARRLFDSSKNEIFGVDAWPELDGVLGLTRLSELKAHRDVLTRALHEAEQRLLIVSPYIRPGPIDQDGIKDLVESARQRGVDVCVAYCKDLNTTKKQKAATKKAAEVLKNAGAQVWALDRVHRKTLVVDRAWIVEGSFNWLSAARIPNLPWQNHEVSLMYSGEKASSWIEATWQEVHDHMSAHQELD